MRRRAPGGRAEGEGCRPADRRLSPAVFRSQLPRRNDTYAEEPPPEEPPPEEPPPDPAAAAAALCRLRSGAALCRVCGCLGPRACGRCRRAAYCGAEHQALDWRRGHRRCCGQPAAGGGSRGGAGPGARSRCRLRAGTARARPGAAGARPGQSFWRGEPAC